MSVLVPGFAGGAILETFRGMYRAARFPSAVVPSVLTTDAAASWRARMHVEGMAPFCVADQGRYQVNTAWRDEAAFAELADFAAAIVERPLAVAGGRWTAMGHGDYTLTLGDRRTRPDGDFIELTADFSVRSTDQAEVVYSDGRDTVVVPQWPLSIAVVARTPHLYRYERYLTHTVGDAQVYRLRLELRDARRGV